MLSRLVAIGLVVGAPASLAAQGAFPWKAGDPAPALARIHLADQRGTLDSLLGPPSRVQALDGGALALMYDSPHVSVVWTKLDGAAVIDLWTRAAGDIAGVRVDDSLATVIARWGQPTTADGPNGLYMAGSWVVVVQADSTFTKVAHLSLGRVQN